MKLAVEFPSVIYREGPAGVTALAQAIERAGYDQIDIFDHVVMPFPAEGRPSLRYPSEMPILEALTSLAYLAAVTTRIGLGTEVLILPQRQPVLVAKQVSTISTLSGGRVRLGIGVGWQDSEFAALGSDFHTRGQAMDETIRLLRACWTDTSISFGGRFATVEAMAMEPKPPQPGGPPIWIGGGAEAALKRAGTLGDGYLSNAGAALAGNIAAVKRYAEAAGRDPRTLGYQAQLSAPPRRGESTGSAFYANLDGVAAAAAEARAAGANWATVNATGVFMAGARSGVQLAEALAALHDRLRQEVGYD